MTVLPSSGATIFGLNAPVITGLLGDRYVWCFRVPGRGSRARRERDSETAGREPEQHLPRPGELRDPCRGKPFQLGEPRVVRGLILPAGAGQDAGVGPDLGS